MKIKEEIVKRQWEKQASPLGCVWWWENVVCSAI